AIKPRVLRPQQPGGATSKHVDDAHRIRLIRRWSALQYQRLRPAITGAVEANCRGHCASIGEIGAAVTVQIGQNEPSWVERRAKARCVTHNETLSEFSSPHVRPILDRSVMNEYDVLQPVA